MEEENKMLFESGNSSDNYWHNTINGLLDDIQKLAKRIKYLESLYKCTCPTTEEQSKMVSGKWHCSLHGITIIHFQSPITRLIDRIEGHLAK